MPSWASANPTGPPTRTTSEAVTDTPSRPARGPVQRAPRTADLPADTLILGGPGGVDELGGPEALLSRLERALSRPGPAVVVATSGSTGRPKRTVLSTASLRASAEATAARTGGHGQWLLCLPAHYVAGLQVLARSVIAGTHPVLRPPGPFDPLGFARTARDMDHGLRHVSLVPTQLARLVDAAEDVSGTASAEEAELITGALRSFDSILLGGSAVSPHLLDRARGLGAQVVTTYGMSETCGGCVYDGAALEGVSVRIGAVDDAADDDAVPEPTTAQHAGPGRIWLGGEVVTHGYLDDPAQTAAHVRVADGRRWYRTDDLGELARGRLRVHGRTDDVVVTGGVKVSAGVVAAVLREDPGVAEAVVVGIPDPQWGQAIAAAVIPVGADEQLRHRLGATVREALGPAAVPKLWRFPAAVPLLPTGKPDRRAVQALFADPPR